MVAARRYVEENEPLIARYREMERELDLRKTCLDLAEDSFAKSKEVRQGGRLPEISNMPVALSRPAHIETQKIEHQSLRGSSR